MRARGGHGWQRVDDPERTDVAGDEPSLLLQLPDRSILRALTAATTTGYVKYPAPLEVEVVLHKDHSALIVACDDPDSVLPYHVLVDAATPIWTSLGEGSQRPSLDHVCAVQPQ